MKTLTIIALTLISFCTYAQMSETEVRSRLEGKICVIDGLPEKEYEIHYNREKMEAYFRGIKVYGVKYHFNETTCIYDANKVGLSSSDYANFMIDENGDCYAIEFLGDSKYRTIHSNGPSYTTTDGIEYTTSGWVFFDLKQ